MEGSIIVATDGGSAASDLLRVAATAARQVKQPILVVSALEDGENANAVALGMKPSDGVAMEIERLVRAHVTSLARPALGEADFRVHVEAGRAASVVPRIAREHHASLIIVGQGHPNAVDRFFGDAALNIVRAADRPVLVVPSDSTTRLHARGELIRRTWPPRRIIAGIDFSPTSLAAARAAYDLLPDGGTLALVHVQQRYSPTVDELKEFRADYEMRASVALDRAVALLDRSPLRTIEPAILEGDIERRLIEFARETHADVIAVGRSGHGVAERLFAGGIALRLVRHSPLPLLIAPPPPLSELDPLVAGITGVAEHRDRHEWRDVLAGFTRRNRGRRSRLDVADTGRDATLAQSGYAFAGATYDDDRGEIRLTLDVDPDDTGQRNDDVHLVRRAPERVVIACGPDGREALLHVEHADGTTTLRFDD